MKTSRTWMCLALALACAGFAAAQDGSKGAQDPFDADEARLDALRRGYEAQLRGQEIRVSLNLRNATVQEGVQQFRQQVLGWDFILDSTNIPEEYRIDEFIVQDKPWRDAFDLFLAKAQLMLDEERLDTRILRISRPAPLTLNMKDADIKAVIDLIARISRANIVVSPKVSGTITLTVNDVPWTAVLNTVVQTLGNFTIVREPFNILRIIDAEELKSQMETEVFIFKYIQPPATYRAKIEESKQISGRPIVPPTSIDDIMKQFALLKMLESVLTRAGTTGTGAILGRLLYDPERNAIIVTDTKVVLDRIRDILKRLDVEPEQVIVDVKFVSTINEDLLNFGVNFNLGANEGLTVTTAALNPFRIDATATTPGTSTAAPFGAAGAGKVTRLPFGLGSEFQSGSQFFLTSYDMLATLRAFRRDRFSKLVQEPTLSVIDNTEATIFVGESVPYAEVNSAATQFGTFEFTISEGRRSPVKVGFTLLVIPKILRNENKVIMTVIPQNDALTGRTSPITGFDRFEIAGLPGATATTTIDLPRIASAALITRLLVESGRTAVIGGLVTERVAMEDKKIPFLGDIPLINFFFRQRNDSTTREHLLIFITPRIVRGARVAEENLSRQMRELEEMERRQLEEVRLRRAQEEMRKADEERMRRAAEELEQPK